MSTHVAYLIYLIIANTTPTQSQPPKILTKESARFSGTFFETDYSFNAPFNGEIYGIELVYKSGTGIRCTDQGGYTKWGCDVYDAMTVQMILNGNNPTTYYPTGTTDNVTSLQTLSCPNGCDVLWFKMNNYNFNSDTIELIDGANPYSVSVNDTFSLQYSEGCCGEGFGYSVTNNVGSTYADVYFLYTTTPTSDPTANPTPNPTSNPTNDCESDGEIKHINWNELQNAANNSAQIPYSSFTMALDMSKLEMTFDIDLEYVGSSFDSNSNVYNLGTTYVVDFQSFETSGNKINEPGNCQNRIYASFQNLAFDEWWDYSEYPYLSSNDLGSNTYLSYPAPSEYWTLSIDPLSCSPINYYGIFSWNDLSECIDYNGNNLINIVDNNITITLSGTFYVNLVSPYSMSTSDTGIYRTFPLIQQDFEISLLKQINIISSSGIELFITSIIGIYENETDGSFKLSVLTQCADYIELINPIIISTPFGGGAAAIITSVTSSCLVASSYTCGQIFIVTIDESQILCPPADFSGDYNLQFQVSCPGNEVVCAAFIDDNNGSIIALSVTSNFIDTTCEPELYQVIFDGNMQFYDDEQFNTIHDNANDDNNYVIGQDTIYIKVESNFPDDGSGDNFIIFGVEINNVFVCTADDNIDLTHNLTQQNGNGGCLSSSIDPDGPYNIISNGIVNNDYQTQIILNSGTSNIVQFSFLTFDIGRTTMYIHVQLTLILQNGARRRLQLLQTNNNDANSNQIRHFIDSTMITHQEEINVFTTEYDQKEDNHSDATSYKLMKSTIKMLFFFFQFLFIAHINCNN